MEEPKPEQLGEESMRVWSGEISIVDSHIWSGEIKIDDNPDEEVQPNSNSESNEDNEKKNVLKCPKCGETDHEPGAKFCNKCGSKFSEAANEEKEMEENGQLRINFETEEAEQDDNAEVEANGQLRIPFENEEEIENDEK